MAKVKKELKLLIELAEIETVCDEQTKLVTFYLIILGFFKHITVNLCNQLFEHLRN